MVTVFADDDQSYLAWIAANPSGFVLNVRTHDDPDYIVAHRARCGTITSTRSPNAYTGRGYRKVCGATLADLSTWSASHGRPDGSFSKLCGRCNPNCAVVAQRVRVC